jgi:hypothetical protein
LLRIFKELKSSDVWNTLQDHWKLYQKKHYARDNNQVEELREPEEECVRYHTRERDSIITFLEGKKG